MDASQHARGEEDAAFGRFLIETVANLFGCEPDPERIDRCIYKHTDCGAWIRFDANGIQVGTIVEGSDAEYDEWVDVSGIEMSEEGAALLVDRVSAAIQRCEDFSDEVWGEMEMGDGSPDDE